MSEPRERKIDPRRRPVNHADDGPIEAGATIETEWNTAGLPAPDLDCIRSWRLERLRGELQRRDLAGAVLLDPINIRYATDACNMQIYCMHDMGRYAFVAADGPVVLFEIDGFRHLSAHLHLIDEVRSGLPLSYFGAGSREREMVHQWAREIGDLIREHGGGNRRIAIDQPPPGGEAALAAVGLEVEASRAFAEHARMIKNPEEIKAMRRAIHAAEQGMMAMWQVLEPGITENALWAELHRANIVRGGEWIETRLLSSGPRTNPWYRECSDRVIEAGDMVSFDTDLIGPYGYCADISRAWVAAAEPTAEQRALHEIAVEHVTENSALVGPGVSFREFSERSHRLPPDCRANRYSCLVHGVGLCDESPSIYYPEDWAASGEDGMLEPGMTVCVEAYVGREGGREGIKIERQLLVTDTGAEFLDHFPLELHVD